MVLASPALPEDGRKRFVWNSPEWWEWFTAFRRKPSVTSIQPRLAEYESFVSFQANAIAFNPADGVKRPNMGSNEGKSPALSRTCGPDCDFLGGAALSRSVIK